MDDFEQFLKRQTFRTIPAEWRDEILSAAQPKRAGENPVQTPWWLAWLWPSPVAWAGVACAWLIIIGLNLASRPSANENIARGNISWRNTVDFVMQQRQLVQELFRSEAEPVEPPRNRRTPGACNGRATEPAIV